MRVRGCPPGSVKTGLSDTSQEYNSGMEQGDQTGLTARPTVARWRRFGHDRLYVKDGEEQLGYWDLKADEGFPAEERWRAVVHEAVVAWKIEQGVPAPGLIETAVEHVVAPAVAVALEPVAEAPAAPLPPAPTTVVPERPWLDLATNLPGEGVRDVADAAFVAAPVRTTLARVLGVKNDERAWRLGADGEEKVAARLAKVAKRDPRWRFLHSVPVGTRGSDIDHLAIGPGGVFTINTKHHRGAKIWVGGNTFLVDGFRQPYVRNARHEAGRASTLLSAVTGFAVPVDGLIVTVNADEFVVKSQPTGVHVLPRMQVGKWLLRLGEVLDQERCDAIYAVARRSTTWRP